MCVFARKLTKPSFNLIVESGTEKGKRIYLPGEHRSVVPLRGHPSDAGGYFAYADFMHAVSGTLGGTTR
jgi:hypothetical protein